MRALRVIVTAAVAGALGVLGWAELLHWRASWRELGDGSATAGSPVVVVLGYKNRAEHANLVNRGRVRAGIRSIGPATEHSALVFCGGAVAGATPEATLMADYARQRGYAGPIVLETRSRSTWENIEEAIPLIEDATQITIVSDSMHAEFGRAFLREQRPDLAARLTRGADYRFGESTLVKPIAAVIALRNRRRLLGAPDDRTRHSPGLSG